MAIAQQLQQDMACSSWIRQMFEQGQRLKEKFGEDQVFDFSLGNPILEPPAKVHEVLIEYLQQHPPGMHRYMPNAGFPSTRNYLALELSEQDQLPFTIEDIVMCVGAGGGINVAFKVQDSKYQDER